MSTASAESLVLGAVVVAFAILGLGLGVGFLGGRGWAWTLGVVVYILSLPLGVWEVVSASIVGGGIRVVVGLIILYYLTRPKVKVFFGRDAPISAAM